MTNAIAAARALFNVGYSPDWQKIIHVGHHSDETLIKIVKLLDDAIASGSVGEIFPGWTLENQDIAMHEGWCVLECGDGQLVIEANDEDDTFTGETANIDAFAHVKRLADAGSLLHFRALSIVEHPDNLALGRANTEE